VTDRYQYSAYGEILSSSGNTDTPFLYNGRDGVITDANGLYYMRARYYNPEIRRFVSQDILLGVVIDGQSLNRYAYVQGNPVGFVDPLGLAREEGFLKRTTDKAIKWLIENGNVILDRFQTGLDFVGLAPGFGEPADGANAIIYLLRGDETNAALSAGGMIPVAGSFSTGGKYVIKYGDEVIGGIKGTSKAAEGAAKYSDEFTNWINAGNANNKVYQGITNGESVYTGITKQELSTRLYQHNYGGKGLDYLQETFSGLTRNQARSIEQYFIENGPGNALNKINSISPNSVYYDDAMKWATDFINGLK
jgi:RHS repeat-associated protein